MLEHPIERHRLQRSENFFVPVLAPGFGKKLAHLLARWVEHGTRLGENDLNHYNSTLLRDRRAASSGPGLPALIPLNFWYLPYVLYVSGSLASGSLRHFTLPAHQHAVAALKVSFSGGTNNLHISYGFIRTQIRRHVDGFRGTHHECGSARRQMAPGRSPGDRGAIGHVGRNQSPARLGARDLQAT